MASRALPKIVVAICFWVFLTCLNGFFIEIVSVDCVVIRSQGVQSVGFVSWHKCQVSSMGMLHIVVIHCPSC